MARQATPPLWPVVGWPARAMTAHGPRLVRFGLVGASGVLVNIALLYGLVELARLNHLLAAALATEAAILSNFALNHRWTFRRAPATLPWLQRVARYQVIALGGLLISVGVLAALTHWLRLHYLTANLVGIGAGLVWNYSANLCFTWRL
jgi:dolichol-phosphate mannosyltransferase